MEQKNQSKLTLVTVVIIAVIAIFGVLYIKAAKDQAKTKPVAANLHFKTIKDMGREHVPSIAGVNYPSNPPTSGPHFAVWAKRGVYKEVLSDGYLIHSLEHGYVVLSYNCGPKASSSGSLSYKEGDPLTKLNFTPKGQMTFFTPDDAPKSEVTLPSDFNSSSCQTLVNKLAGFLKDFQRVIIVPRPNLDSLIALSAWDKLDKLNVYDGKRIASFLEEFHNKGPEQTIE